MVVSTPLAPPSGRRVATRSSRRLSSARQSVGGNTAENRQLVRPDHSIPWSVDVVGAVPREILGDLDKVVAGASCPGWSCVGGRDGNFFVWQNINYGLSEDLQPPKHVAKVFFPDLIISGTNDERNDKPLLSLASSHDRSVAYLYAAHPTSGWVVMKKVSNKDLRSRLPLPASHSTRTRIELQNEQDGDDAGEKEEVLTCLVASNNNDVVVVGSSIGRLAWLTPTVVPLGLHQQLIPFQTTSSGLWNRLSSIVSSSQPQEDTDSDRIASILPVSSKQFIAISCGGSATLWDVELSVAAAHHATFQPLSLGSLKNLDLGENETISDLTVLRCVLSHDQQSIHFIIHAPAQTEGSRAATSPSKLYWMEAFIGEESNLILKRSFWLSRFPDPKSIEVSGLVACENRNAYVAFSPIEEGNPGDLKPPAIVMALAENSDRVNEVDLPTKKVPSLVIGPVIADGVTHGCLALAKSGLGIRVRFLPPPDASRVPSAGGINPSALQTLVSHLRSAYWQAYENIPSGEPCFRNFSSLIPLSLHQASPNDLERAILSFADELRKKHDLASSTNNPLEQHVALITLLQQSGLYRSVSESVRWQLLSIGQGLAAIRCLVSISSSSSWGREIMKKLQAFDDSPDWLLRVQSDEMNGPHKRTWVNWLLEAWGAATEYREEKGRSLYDIISNRPPSTVRIWTSHSSIQMVLRRQLQVWKGDLASVDREAVETLAEAILHSHSENNLDDLNSRDNYAKMKTLAISLLRSMGDNADEMAFNLSVKYAYFQGLCEMSVDHEKKLDAKQFSLEPLFDTVTESDLVTGFSFAQFVLQWHTDAGMYGHTINYGRHSTADLNHIMQRDERLRPYRWIQAIRQHDHKSATDSFIDNAASPNAIYADHSLQLSLAKLSNKLGIVTPAAATEKRQKFIEHKLEIANVQQMLLASTGMSTKEIANATIWPPEKLIELALDRLNETTDPEERTEQGFIALVICACIDTASGAEYAARIWAECLLFDSDQWMEWIQTRDNFSDSSLIAETSKSLFGTVLKECRSDTQLKGVTYSPHMEIAVMEAMGINDVTLAQELCRLLRSVSRQPNISAESLVVSSY